MLRRARGFAAQSGLGSSVDSYYLGVAALGRNDVAAARQALPTHLEGKTPRKTIWVPNKILNLIL